MTVQSVVFPRAFSKDEMANFLQKYQYMPLKGIDRHQSNWWRIRITEPNYAHYITRVLPNKVHLVIGLDQMPTKEDMKGGAGIKIYYGIRPLKKNKKGELLERHPTLQEAFDARQIRHFGIKSSKAIGNLQQMKKSQLKEIKEIKNRQPLKVPKFKPSKVLVKEPKEEPKEKIVEQVIKEPAKESNKKSRAPLNDPDDILYTVCNRLYRYYNTMLKDGTASNEDQRLQIARLTYRYRDWAKKIKDENPSVKLIDDKIRNLDSKYLNDRMLEIWYEKEFLHNKYRFSEDNEVNQVRYAIDYEKKIVPMIRDILKPTQEQRLGLVGSGGFSPERGETSLGRKISDFSSSGAKQKIFYGMRDLKKNKKGEYLEVYPTLQQALDKKQIRWWGVEKVANHTQRLGLTRAGEPRVNELKRTQDIAATKIQSLVRMKNAKKQLKTLKDNVRKKTYNDLIKMLETYKDIRQNADYYKNNREEFQKKIKEFTTERSTLVNNKLDDLDHEIIVSILSGIDKKIFIKLNELTKLIKYVNDIYENLGTPNEEVEKNNLMKYIYSLIEDI